MSLISDVVFLPVKEENRTAFFGEDIHIDVPRGNASEVVFIRANHSSEVVLMRAGQVVQSGLTVPAEQGGKPLYYVNSLGNLVVEDVQERDEGVYIVRNANSSNIIKRLNLMVRGKMSAGRR